MKFGHKKLYIGGKLVESSSGTNYQVICPGDETHIATVAWADKSDTAKALSAAQAGFAFWSSLTVAERVEWMQKLRSKIADQGDELRECVMYEMGKTWESTAEDLTSLLDSLEFYANAIIEHRSPTFQDRQGTHVHEIIEQPVGVVAAFLAYNFPLLNLGFKLGPALAAGCSIIIKPSEHSPLSAYLLGEICADINFPAGVINIICGEIGDVGKPLCESKVPRLITMIGATNTAQKLIEQSAGTSIKRYSMECGGNAPFIVFPDANIQEAASIGSALKTGNSGQICVAPNRFYVHEEVVDEFLHLMEMQFAKTSVGFGLEEKPDMGPLANAQSLTKVKDIVLEATAQGGELLCGGKSLERPGYFFEPTIIRFRQNDAEIFMHEIFGPIAFVTTFSDRDEVLALANGTNAGLASYVFSSSEETLDFFATHLEFGEVQLNGVRYDINLPHGGIKDSGIGFDCSTLALDDYLIKKRVSRALS